MPKFSNLVYICIPVGNTEHSTSGCVYVSGQLAFFILCQLT